jgi:dihydrofolate reductase
MGADEIIVAGGADLYRQTLPLASRLDVTEVDLSPAGDAVFPPVDPNLWEEFSRTPFEKGEKDDASFTAVVYERR